MNTSFQAGGFEPFAEPGANIVSSTASRLGGVVDAKNDFGVTGSAQNTTGTIGSGSASLTLASIIDFAVGNGIRVSGAGPLCTLNAPSSLTVTPTGTTGGTAYTYTIAPYDVLGGCGPAIANVTTTTGNASLSATNYNALSWSAPSGTAPSGYAIYGRSSGSMVLIATTNQTSFSDIGQTVTAPDFLLSTPPGSATAQSVVTSITAISGSVATLAVTATTAVTGGYVEHDDTVALQAFINRIISVGAIGVMPPGQINVSAQPYANSATTPHALRGASDMLTTISVRLPYLYAGIGWNSCGNFEFSDFTLDCGSLRGCGCTHGISNANSFRSRIRRVRVVNYLNTGILVYTASLNTYYENIVEDCFTDGNTVYGSMNGISIVGMLRSGIRRSGAINVTSPNPGLGIQLKNGGVDNWVDDCWAENCFIGLGFGNDNPTGEFSPRATGFSARSCTAGFWPGGCTSGNVDGLMIDMNNGGKWGMRLQTTVGMHVSATVHNVASGTYAAYIDTGCSYIDLELKGVDGPAVSSPFVYVASGVTYCHVVITCAQTSTWAVSDFITNASGSSTNLFEAKSFNGWALSAAANTTRPSSDYPYALEQQSGKMGLSILGGASTNQVTALVFGSRLTTNLEALLSYNHTVRQFTISMSATASYTWDTTGLSPVTDQSPTLGTSSLRWAAVYSAAHYFGTNNNQVTFGTTAPGSGTWVTGDVRYNSAPASGSPVGWSCTAGGAPGTWKPWANLP